MGLGFWVSLILLCFGGSAFLPCATPTSNDAQRLHPPLYNAHWLGTDSQGREVWARLLCGGRTSLFIGFASVGLSLMLGVVLGLGAGYLGGWVDEGTMRLIDLVLAFPGFIFAVWLATLWGPGIPQVIGFNTLFGLPLFARFTRGAVLTLKEQDYILAARALGAGPPHIILHHLLPNLGSPLLVLASLSLAGALLSGAGLSYLGLGAQAPTAEWGAMLQEGRTYINTAWWLTLFPGGLLFLTVLASNLVSEGLRDALAPPQ